MSKSKNEFVEGINKITVEDAIPNIDAMICEAAMDLCYESKLVQPENMEKKAYLKNFIRTHIGVMKLESRLDTDQLRGDSYQNLEDFVQVVAKNIVLELGDTIRNWLRNRDVELF